jgi:hypothetical protein
MRLVLVLLLVLVLVLVPLLLQEAKHPSLLLVALLAVLVVALVVLVLVLVVLVVLLAVVLVLVVLVVLLLMVLVLCVRMVLLAASAAVGTASYTRQVAVDMASYTRRRRPLAARASPACHPTALSTAPRAATSMARRRQTICRPRHCPHTYVAGAAARASSVPGCAQGAHARCFGAWQFGPI